MKNKISLLIFDMIGLLILVALDQLTKYMAVVFLKANDSVPIFQGILELRYLEIKARPLECFRIKRFSLFSLLF